MENKQENDERVIYIANLESRVLRQLVDAQSKFWSQRPEHSITSAMHRSATYLFENLDGAKYFGELLEEMRVHYSYHPAEDFDRLATENDRVAQAINRTFRYKDDKN